MPYQYSQFHNSGPYFQYAHVIPHSTESSPCTHARADAVWLVQMGMLAGAAGGGGMVTEGTE
jgi:hypothetical protein